MPLEQRVVPLVLQDGSQRKAVATGNNAAWNCPCGRDLPLLGRSGLASGVTNGYRVDCPSCDGRYFVVPDGGDQKRTLRVEQVL
jgi:hypothetical protein